MSNIKLFEGPNIRAKWNEDEDAWWFVVQDVIAFLTDSSSPSKYWSALKARTAQNEGVELSTNCRQLKFIAKDGKQYKYECANNETLFRIIQSVPSPKAEPFKRWLAQLGKERIEEIEQPEKAIERAKTYYEHKGHSKEWVSDRIQGVTSRNDLTDYWKSSGVVDGKSYAILTNQIYASTFGLTALQYKSNKGIKKSDSLRDNMNSLELVVTRFAEITSKEIAESTNAKGLEGNRKAIDEAGKIIKKAVNEIETKTGKKVVSKSNNKHLNTPEKTKEIIQAESNKKIVPQTPMNKVLKGMLAVPPPRKDKQNDEEKEGAE